MSAIVEFLGEMAIAFFLPSGERTPSWVGGAIVFGTMAAAIACLFLLPVGRP